MLTVSEASATSKCLPTTAGAAVMRRHIDACGLYPILRVVPTKAKKRSAPVGDGKIVIAQADYITALGFVSTDAAPIRPAHGSFTIRRNRHAEKHTVGQRQNHETVSQRGRSPRRCRQRKVLGDGCALAAENAYTQFSVIIPCQLHEAAIESTRPLIGPLWVRGDPVPRRLPAFVRNQFAGLENKRTRRIADDHRVSRGNGRILADDAQLPLPDDMAVVGVYGAHPARRLIRILRHNDEPDCAVRSEVNLSSVQRRTKVGGLGPSCHEARPFCAVNVACKRCSFPRVSTQ